MRATSYISKEVPQKELRICFCVFPFATQSTRVHALGVVNILQEFASILYVITPRMPEDFAYDQQVVIKNLAVNLHPRESIRPIFLSVLFWVLKYLAIQIEMCYHLTKAYKKVDIVIFYEGSHYLLPAILAKFFRKKVVKYSPALPRTRLGSKRSLDYWATNMSRKIEETVLCLSDSIITAIEDHTHQTGQAKHGGKISVAMYTYMGSPFMEKNDWRQRDNIVGYVGRLIEVRGVRQLARAIPLIFQRRKDVRFMIVGDGVLMDEIKKYSMEMGYAERVEFIGWVPNEKIPDYLNKMRFHISPAFEDFPGTVNLEAMACGTIAIANAVDGVRDIIADNETGFLLKDNEPQTIADRLIEVLDHPGLEEIRQKAKSFVKQNFSRQRVLNDWQRILSEL